MNKRKKGKNEKVVQISRSFFIDAPNLLTNKGNVYCYKLFPNGHGEYIKILLPKEINNHET